MVSGEFEPVRNAGSVFVLGPKKSPFLDGVFGFFEELITTILLLIDLNFHGGWKQMRKSFLGRLAS